MHAVVHCGIPPESSPIGYPNNLRITFSAQHTVFHLVRTAIALVPVADNRKTERQKIECTTQPFIQKQSLMKTILVAANFSESAIHAATYAARLSAQVKADYLILYHAYQLLPGLDSSAMGAPASKAKTKEYNEDFLKQLRQDLIGLVAPDTLILTRTEATELGRGITDLAAVCEEGGVLIIGSSSYPTKSPPIAWKESGTGKLLQAAPLPLLIVPRSAEFQPIKKIMLACDFENITDTLPFVRLRQLVETLAAQLSVVHVNRPFGKKERTRESTTFSDVFEDLDPSIAYIKSSDISRGILNHAAEIGAQLIVVVAKDQTSITRLLHGSITKQLALQSDIPVLIIRRKSPKRQTRSSKQAKAHD